jgi:hypothetical protein
VRGLIDGKLVFKIEEAWTFHTAKRFTEIPAGLDGGGPPSS